MKRDDLTEKILDTKRVSGMSWEDIAEKIGGCSPILITAALLGQMKLSPAPGGSRSRAVPSVRG